MHRFLVATDACQADDVVFSADQAHQLRHVLRLRPGEQVCVFDGTDQVDWLVELVAVAAGAAHGRIVGRRAQPPEPRARLVVYPALLPRDKFEVVLQKLTELGASAIVPVRTSRGLVRELPDDRRLLRWRAILREAAEQCGRGVVPSLGAGLALGQAVEQATVRGTVLLAYEAERQMTLRQALAGAGPEVGLFVGPEGGYATEEVEHARAAGAQVVTLGPRVLRAETAGPVLAALVLYELGDLSSGPP